MLNSQPLSRSNLPYTINRMGEVTLQKEMLFRALEILSKKYKLHSEYNMSSCNVLIQVNKDLQAQFNCRMLKALYGRSFFVNNLQDASVLKINQYVRNNFYFRGKGARGDEALKFVIEFHEAMGFEVDEHFDILEFNGEDYGYQDQKNFD